MVVTRNIGRLGNNMFQIANSIGYAKRYGYTWASDAWGGVSEPYSSIHQTYPNLPKEHFGSGVRFHEHNNEFCQLHRMHKDDCHFDYHPHPDLGPNVSFTGFYQSYKYFENAEEEVKKVFELPHWKEYEDYVSIHVRRGDYVQYSGSFPPITVDYVERALGKLIHLNPIKLIVFSDDIAWCKQNMSHWTGIVEFSECRTDRQDLEIMASCRHHIIANSTFSWWAAYLGHNPERIVIAPSCKRGSWFGMQAGVKKDVVDLLPPNWIQIDR